MSVWLHVTRQTSAVAPFTADAFPEMAEHELVHQSDVSWPKAVTHKIW